MLNYAELKEIILENDKKFNSIYSLANYVRNCNIDDQGKKNLSTINVKSLIFWKKILYSVFRYAAIGYELRSARNMILNNIYNSYAIVDLSQIEFTRIIENQRNYWLNMNYLKIAILRDSCDAVMSNPGIIESICKKEKEKDPDKPIDSIKNEYKDIRDKSIDIFNQLIQKTKKLYDEECRAHYYKWTIGEQVDKYNESINNYMFLTDENWGDDVGKEN